MLDCKEAGSTRLIICLVNLSGQFVERDLRDKQKVVESLKDSMDKQRQDLDSLRKEIKEKERLCSALKVWALCSSLLKSCNIHTDSQSLQLILCSNVSQTQMSYMETQQNEVQAAKEEVRSLRTKLRTFERYLQPIVLYSSSCDCRGKDNDCIRWSLTSAQTYTSAFGQLQPDSYTTAIMTWNMCIWSSDCLHC